MIGALIALGLSWIFIPALWVDSRETIETTVELVNPFRIDIPRSPRATNAIQGTNLPSRLRVPPCHRLLGTFSNAIRG